MTSRPDDTLRVAGLVLKWVRGNRPLNLARIEPMIREAAERGAQLAVTTECFLDGYAVRDKSIPLDAYFAMGEPLPDGPYFRRLAELARELEIHLAIGVHEVSGVIHYNTAALIDPDGQLVGRYHKHRLGHEVDRHAPAPQGHFPVFPTRLGTLGMMICADRARIHIAGGLADNGADLILCLSGGSFGPEKNDPGLRERSRETGRHIVFVHPAEFLVTGPDGRNIDVRLFGDPAERGAALLVSEDEIGSARDDHCVCLVDLPQASQ